MSAVIEVATITKEQIINLAKDVKALVRKEGSSFSDRLEAVLLGNYDNVYTDDYGIVRVRLHNGLHVDLFEIV